MTKIDEEYIQLIPLTVLVKVPRCDLINTIFVVLPMNQFTWEDPEAYVYVLIYQNTQTYVKYTTSNLTLGH